MTTYYVLVTNSSFMAVDAETQEQALSRAEDLLDDHISIDLLEEIEENSEGWSVTGHVGEGSEE